MQNIYLPMVILKVVDGKHWQIMIVENSIGLNQEIAFVSEHSETLVELDIEYKNLANQSGIKNYYRVPAVGTHPSFISGLGDLILETFEGQQKVFSELDPKLCNREHLLCPLV